LSHLSQNTGGLPPIGVVMKSSPPWFLLSITTQLLTSSRLLSGQLTKHIIQKHLLHKATGLPLFGIIKGVSFFIAKVRFIVDIILNNKYQTNL
jgi:hypothetical protein